MKARTCEIMPAAFRPIILGTLLLNAACSTSSRSPVEAGFLAREHLTAPEEFAGCAKLVDDHVSSTTKWKRRDYKVDYAGPFPEGSEFRVSHVDDYRGPNSRQGGGTSILVQADCASGRVLRVLHYQ